MEDDMVKDESQFINILCNLEQIYPPAFFDIMIHLVMHLPEEALKGRNIPYRKIGKQSLIRLDHQEMKKVIWYVLHKSPEIDMYLAKFEGQFPNSDMKQEFPRWFDPHVNLLPSPTPISVNSCVVNGVRFFVHSRDERRTTQNSGICSPGEKEEEMYYGQLEEILEFAYISFKVVLF
ncbi:S-adenosyl-L-methionine-dependent methyltransferases superfamily protein [Tanacetum coccineum]